MADTPAKSRRRWPRFSLRTMFVVVTAVGATIAIVGWMVRVYVMADLGMDRMGNRGAPRNPPATQAAPP